MAEDERWDEPPISDGLDVPQRSEFIFTSVSVIEEGPGATWMQQAQRSGPSLGGSEPPPPPPDPAYEVWDEPPDRDDLQRPDKRDADRRWGVALAGLGLVFLLLGGGIDCSPGGSVEINTYNSACPSSQQWLARCSAIICDPDPLKQEEEL